MILIVSGRLPATVFGPFRGQFEDDTRHPDSRLVNGRGKLMKRCYQGIDAIQTFVPPPLPDVFIQRQPSLGVLNV